MLYLQWSKLLICRNDTAAMNQGLDRKLTKDKLHLKN